MNGIRIETMVEHENKVAAAQRKVTRIRQRNRARGESSSRNVDSSFSEARYQLDIAVADLKGYRRGAAMVAVRDAADLARKLRAGTSDDWAGLHALLAAAGGLVDSLARPNEPIAAKLLGGGMAQ